jgi:hypothetical protein
VTNLSDLAILSDVWLTGNEYRDIYPRRTGDGVVDCGDFGIFGLHWRESGL